MRKKRLIVDENRLEKMWIKLSEVSEDSIWDCYLEGELYIIKKDKLEEVIGKRIEDEEEEFIGDEMGRVVVYIENGLGLWIVNVYDILNVISKEIEKEVRK